MKEKSPQRFPGHKKLLNLAAAGAMLFGGAGCADNSPSNTDSSPQLNISLNSTPTSSQSPDFKRVLPLAGTGYLTQGAHAWNDSPTEIKSSIDIAPQRVANCSPGARLTIDEQDAVASASGTIIAVGDQNNRNDRYHSTVQIREDGTGIIFEEMHLDKFPENIKVGAKVKAGQPIGKPSCETQPGGFTTGIHVHLGLINPDGKTRPSIDGISFSGWTVKGELMSKTGIKDRTANLARCNTDTVCAGIRNDLDGLFITAPNTGDAGLKFPTPAPTPTPAKTPEKPQPNLVINLKYADGKPIPHSQVDIFKQGKVENGKVKTDGNRIQAVETGADGAAKFNLPAGRYLALFQESYASQTEIEGEEINSDYHAPGMADIDVNDSGSTIKDYILGRLLIHFSDGPQYSKNVCVYLKSLLISTGCYFTNKDSMSVDLVPSQNYDTKVYTSQSISVTGEVKIGNTPLRSGQITELFCSTIINPGCSIIPPKN